MSRQSSKVVPLTAASPHVNHPPEPDARPLSVLVVDDAADRRMAVRFALEASGFVLQEAADAGAALRVAGVQPPDCVLLDEHFAEGSEGGILSELVRGARKAPYGAVVMMVAEFSAARFEALLAQGVHDVFPRSRLGDADLHRTVRNAVRYARLAGAAGHSGDAAARLAAVVGVASEPIVSFGPDAETIVGWNPAATRLFGYSEAEALGRSVNELIVPPEFRRERESFARHLLQDGSPLVHQVLRRHRDGAVFPVELRLSRVAAVDGLASGFVAVFRDLSRRLPGEADQAPRQARLDAIRQALGGGRAASAVRVLAETVPGRSLDERGAPRAGEDAPRQEALRHPEWLDGRPNPALQALVRLARLVIDAPIAVLSAVGSDRRLLVASEGLPAQSDSERQGLVATAFCRHVVVGRSPLVISDAGRHPLTSDGDAASHGLVAYLGVPVTDGQGRPLGALAVLDDRVRAWTQSELDALQGIAELVMREIANRGLVDELGHELKRFESIRAAFTALAGDPSRFDEPLPPTSQARIASNDPVLRGAALEALGLGHGAPEPVFEQITRLASAILMAPVSLLTVTDASHQRFIAAHGLTGVLGETRQTPIEWSICRSVIDGGEAVVVPDFTSAADAAAAAELRLRSYLGVPVRDRGGVVVASLCVCDLQPRRWSRRELALLEGLAGLLDRELENRSIARELRASREDMDRAQAVAHMGSWRFDLERGSLTWSKETHRIFGVPEGARLSYRTFLRAVHPDDRTYVGARWRAARIGETYEIEHRILRGGEIRWVRQRVRLERDGRGRPASGYGTTQDVTERKETERATARLAAIVSSSSDAILAKSLEGTILSWNAAAESLLGYAADEVIGRSIRQLVPPERQPEEAGFLARIAAGQVIRNLETVRLHKSGRRIDVALTVSPILDAAGRVTGASSIMRDIAERRQSEMALRASEERLRTIVETAQEGIWAIDRRGRTIFANPRIAELLGLSPHDMAEACFFDFCDEEDAEDAGRLLAELAVAGTRTFEFRFRRRDGRILHVLAATAPLHGLEPGSVGILGGFLDLTERKVAEERQRVLMRELAHRGKNLLAVVNALVRRTLTGSRSLADGRDLLLGRITALSRTYASLTDEVFEGAPLEAIVRAELASFGGRAVINGPRIMLAARVAQTLTLAVHELATNAAKYGALSVPGGRVVVDWSVEPRAGGMLFRFAWTENDGPVVSPPERRGFGSVLVGNMVGAELSCTPALEFDARGLRYGFEASLSKLGTVLPDLPVRAKIRNLVLAAFHDAWRRQQGTRDHPPTLEETLESPGLAVHGALTVAEITTRGEARFLQPGGLLSAQAGALTVDRPLDDDDIESARDAFLRCARERSPVHELRRFDFGEGGEATFERLVLPFSSDGAAITHVAALAVITTAGEADGDAFRTG